MHDKDGPLGATTIYTRTQLFYKKNKSCITVPILHRKVENCYKNLMEKIEIICTQCMVILSMRQTSGWYIAVIYFNHVKMEDTTN